MSHWSVSGELLDAGTSAWQQLDVISDILMILLYREENEDDLFYASIGAFISMPILIGLIFALTSAKKDPFRTLLEWFISTWITFIFNALAPIATFFFHMPCICNGATATNFKFFFVVGKAAEQVLESIPQLVINAIYISRTWKKGDSFFQWPIMSLIASAISILFFLIRFPKTYKEVSERSESFKKKNADSDNAENVTEMVLSCINIDINSHM